MTVIQPISMSRDPDSGRLRLAGEPVFVGTSSELLEQVETLIGLNEPQLVVTPNVDQSLELERDAGFMRAYRSASLRLLDGMPLVLLARALGESEAERHTGADLLPRVAEESARRNWRVVIAGGRSEVSETAVRKLKLEHPGADLTSVSFPILASVEDPQSLGVVEDIRRAAPDIVFLCLGSPKQEQWFMEWKHVLPTAVYVGAGAAVDFSAGLATRAPKWVQSAGFEWAWRLAQEPKRLSHRYLVKGPRFIAIVMRSLVGGSK